MLLLPATVAAQSSTSISSASELAAVLVNTSVAELVIQGNISLTLDSWPNGGLAIPAGHNVTLQGPGAIDFGGLASAITVSSNATLRLSDITISGVASRYLLDHPKLATPWGLDGYPSIVAQPNSTEELSNATMYYPGDDCGASYMNSHYGAFILQFGNAAVQQLGPLSVSVNSGQYYDVPLSDTSTQAVVATSHFLIQRSISICHPDPLYVASSPPTVASGAPSSSHSGGLAWYVIFVIVVGVVLALALTVTGAWWLHKQRRKMPISVESGLGADHQGGRDDLEKLPPATEWMPGPWNVRHGPIDGLTVSRMLGRGSFGRVYKGTWKGTEVAVKVIDVRSRAAGAVCMSLESIVSTAVCHPHVVNTYKVCTTSSTNSGPKYNDSANSQDSDISSSGSSEKLKKSSHAPKRDLLETWMVLEYCDKGSLETALDNHWLHSPNVGLPDMPGIYCCLLDVASGMDYLHSVGILHGDLKTANVLLKSTPKDSRGYICKLADFGLSRLLDGTQTHISTQSFGTITHMPAELLRNGKLTRAVDVYSFGMLMWELISGQPLYGGLTAPEVYHKVVYEDMRPMLPPHCPAPCRELMEQCWHQQAGRRPTFDAIIKVLQALAEVVGPASAPLVRDSYAALDEGPEGDEGYEDFDKGNHEGLDQVHRA
ncbi:hypothetical protein WJX72_008849 [[Myrmecia] bisecta]|uniref:Protein kinase domain-containing protein n=1 Tax=[Myrmecia] bisecta TaxID=41462 RepID=A0AAW1Q4S7_9CHLO